MGKSITFWPKSSQNHFLENPSQVTGNSKNFQVKSSQVVSQKLASRSQNSSQVKSFFDLKHKSTKKSGKISLLFNFNKFLFLYEKMDIQGFHSAWEIEIHFQHSLTIKKKKTNRSQISLFTFTINMSKCAK